MNDKSYNNREVLFKGTCIETGNLVYGGYFQYTPDEDGVRYYIFSFNEGAIEVHQDSIKQFTGLLDRKVNKIFEGDKVKIYKFYHQSGNTADWFGAEPQNSQPCYEEYLDTVYGVVEFKNGSFVVNDIPLSEIVKGLGSEVADFYMCGYGGSELEFIECLTDEDYGEDYYNELIQLEGEEFYKKLVEVVDEITKEIELCG